MTDVLDLSHHNEVASFDAIRKSGIVGIIHKASEGSDYVDPTYAPRRVQAKAAGLLWGAYHFLRPGDQKEHAAHFIKSASPAVDDLICADHEDNTMSLSDLQAFLAAVYALTQRRAVIYSGHLIKEQVGARTLPGLAAHQLWIAHYTSGQPSWPTETWPHYFLWQYTDKGSAPGVSGWVDCNTTQLSETQLRDVWAGRGTNHGDPGPTPPAEDMVVTIRVQAPPGVIVNVVQDPVQQG